MTFGKQPDASLTRPVLMVVYKLDGKVALPPAPPVVPQVLNPPENFGDEALRKHGQDVYELSCTGCHEDGRMFTGYPDLNYTMALNNAPLFMAIVIDGALRWFWASGTADASAGSAPVGRTNRDPCPRAVSPWQGSCRTRPESWPGSRR